jgi:D-alanine-D-alanine ligase
MPVRELIIGRKSANKPRLVSYRLKHDKEQRQRWRVRSEFAALTPEQERNVQKLTLRTFAALDLRDYGRLDLRLSEAGDFVFLEANPNPALTPFNRSLAGIWSAIDYENLIRQIALQALQRDY